MLGACVASEPDNPPPLINLSAFGKVRLGQGVVGKISYVAAILMTGLGVIGWTLGDGYLKLAVAVLMVLAGAGYLTSVLWYADKHPQTSLLEGADLVQWRQLEMAARDKPPLIPDANVAPPIAIESKPTGEG
jgi:hypothetical protein